MNIKKLSHKEFIDLLIKQTARAQKIIDKHRKEKNIKLTPEEQKIESEIEEMIKFYDKSHGKET